MTRHKNVASFSARYSHIYISSPVLSYSFNISCYTDLRHKNKYFKASIHRSKVHNNLLKNYDWLASSIVPQKVRYIWFRAWKDSHTVHKGWGYLVSAQSVLEFYLRCCMYYCFSQISHKLSRNYENMQG